MTAMGVARFRSNDEQAKERDPTDTRAGKRLLKSYVAQVSEFIAHYCAGNRPNGRRRNKYAKIIAGVEPDKLALMSLTRVIEAVFKEMPLQSVCRNIGDMVQDELRFLAFEIASPELYSHIKQRLDDNNSLHYRHRHRNFVHGMKENSVEWQAWDNITSIGIGSLVLSLCMDATDLVKIIYRPHPRLGKTAHVVPTDAVIEWIMEYNSSIEAMTPDRMPCLIKPEPWSTPTDGGYYTRRLKHNTPLVKTRRFDNPERTKALAELLDGAAMPEVYKAINGLQDTAWCINTRVLKVMQEVWEKNLGTGMPPSDPYVPPSCPLPRDMVKSSMTEEQQRVFNEWKAEAREVYTLEKKRVGNVIGVARTMRLASMLQTKELLYFVYQCDFRARVYAATSGVSPQGADTAKSVLQFATARPLGERGLYWLKVHGANKYGVDKSSYDARVAWIEEKHEHWLAVAADPIGNRDKWKDADKPYQFLAFCFEYAEAAQAGAEYRSRLPIALDGSCNGLQHFSAMLRDAVGGAAVNLCVSEVPADIYQSVADVCTADLRSIAKGAGEESAAALNWLDLFKQLGQDGMGRKLAKKPVMTLPYGSTQQACTSSIYQWYVEQRIKFFPQNTAFRHAIFLSRILWAAIGKVVIAARAAMAWIQKCSSEISKLDQPLHYHSPLGFPVFQCTMEQEMTRIRTQIGGRLDLTISQDTDNLDPRKQRQGSSPNLVHDVDATHMMMCVNAGLDAGITEFAMIHDDFGVHACYIDQWHKIIREQFVRLHTEFDILERFKTEHEERLEIELPPVPDRGSLDIKGVLSSPYFFG